MTVNLDPVWLLAFALVFVRALGWLVVMPPFSNRKVVPVPALIGVAGGLAILAAHQVPASALPTDTAGLLGSLVIQIFTGVMLGLPVQFLLSSISSAGSLIDTFGGLNVAPSMDPLSLNQAPLLGQLYEQIGVVLLFATNGEMLLVKGFVASLGKNAITLNSSALSANVLVADMATYFTATLEIAAPLVAVLFATQIALALLSRAAPQINVWILGLPVQVTLTLLMVAIGVRVLPGFLGNLLSRVGQDMATLVNGH